VNEYSAHEGEILLERQTSTIKDGDLSKINPDTFLNNQATLLPYTGKCEIDHSKFEVNQLLGGGNFGSVFEGETNDLVHPPQRIKVAIKVVNNPLDHSQLSVLMSEIKILDKLDVHLNLVNMIGACTTQIKDGKLWLLLEYCPQSDMKKFLLKNREAILQDLKPKTTSDNIFERLFIKWGHGIAKGMEYLFTKRIMYGDLAARNILIGTHGETENRYVAKITDFGLSRAFYDESTYIKQDREKIPWKWMDIYFLETGTFTMSSDVWSFGIVLWEMFSLGRLPYAGGNARDTIGEINSGYRLPVPVEISRDNSLIKIYDQVVKKCLLLNPEQRWTFTDLVDYFETYLTSEEKDDYKRLEDQYVEMQNIITANSKTSN
jgi:serine/threonine protein kinase